MLVWKYQSNERKITMKIAILTFCKPILVGATGVVVATGGAIAGINALQPVDIDIAEEATIIEEAEVSTLEPQVVEVEVEVEETEEVKEVSKVEAGITPPHTNASQAPTKQQTNLPKVSDNPTITKEDPHGSASYNGMSRKQYEDAVKYTCPSQREENVFETWRPAMSRLISIGKYSAYVAVGAEVPIDGVYTITGVPQAYLEPTWDAYKQYPSRFSGEGWFLVAIEDKTVKFYINLSTLQISWGKEDRSEVSNAIAETADYLSISWTNYLRNLDTSYKKRCPND